MLPSRALDPDHLHTHRLSYGISEVLPIADAKAGEEAGRQIQ